MIGISKRNKAAPVFGPGRTYGATGHITQGRYLLAFKNSLIMFLESLQSILDRIKEEDLIPAEQKFLAELAESSICTDGCEDLCHLFVKERWAPAGVSPLGAFFMALAASQRQAI